MAQARGIKSEIAVEFIISKLAKYIHRPYYESAIDT